MSGEQAGGDAMARVAAAQEACEETLKALRAVTDPQGRLEAAGQFSQALRGYSDEAAGIRHDGAAEIHETEKLTLAQLAERVGISKARAGQIVDAAKKGKRDAGADDSTG